MKSPISASRTDVDIVADVAFGSPTDVYNSVLEVSSGIADVLTLAIKVPPFRLSRINKSKRDKLSLLDDPIADIIAKALTRLNIRDSYEDKDKLSLVLNELNSVVDDARPFVNNIHNNVERCKEYKTLIEDIRVNISTTTQQLSSAKETVELKSKTVSRLSNMSFRSNTLKEKAATILKNRQDAVLYYSNIANRLQSNLTALENDLTEKTNALELLESTIKADKFALIEGAMILREMLQEYLGITFNTKYNAILQNYGKW